MNWVWVVLGCLVETVIVIDFFKRRGTLYVSSGLGFVVFSDGTKYCRQVDRDQLLIVVGRLLKGDLINTLWVSWKEDRYSGFILSMENGLPELSIGFKTHSQRAQVDDFKNAMAFFEFPLAEDSDSFNGGFSEECRTTHLEYQVPKSVEAVTQAVDIALFQLSGERVETYFIDGSHSRRLTKPVDFRPSKDLLSQILGEPAS